MKDWIIERGRLFHRCTNTVMARWPNTVWWSMGLSRLKLFPITCGRCGVKKEENDN